jgi:type IV pilus assembly protein PilB
VGKKRLGEFLVESGLISEEDLTKALSEQRTKRGKLGDVIVALGLATESEIAQALAIQLGIPLIDLQNTPVEPQAIELIGEKVARKHLIVPVAIDQKELHIAMADPLSFEAFEDVRFASGYTIKPFLATRTDILWAIDQHYHLGSSLTNIVKDIADERMVEVVGDQSEADGRDIEDLRKKSEAAPVIRMVNLIISEAAEKGASDIHIEPTKTALQIRNRIDGLLHKTMDLPKWVQGAVISREDHGEDGHRGEAAPAGRPDRRPIGGRSLDLRSPRPRQLREKVVIRSSTPPTRPSRSTPWAGPRRLAVMEDIITRPQGIILITGPTGSGKTTTQYGILNRIKTVQENIKTIEDPIEYELEGINQVAVQRRSG